MVADEMSEIPEKLLSLDTFHDTEVVKQAPSNHQTGALGNGGSRSGLVYQVQVQAGASRTGLVEACDMRYFAFGIDVRTIDFTTFFESSERLPFFFRGLRVPVTYQDHVLVEVLFGRGQPIDQP